MITSCVVITQTDNASGQVSCLTVPVSQIVNFTFSRVYRRDSWPALCDRAM